MVRKTDYHRDTLNTQIFPIRTQRLTPEQSTWVKSQPHLQFKDPVSLFRCGIAYATARRAIRLHKLLA